MLGHSFELAHGRVVQLTYLLSDIELHCAFVPSQGQLFLNLLVLSELGRLLFFVATTLWGAAARLENLLTALSFLSFGG